MNKSTTYQKNRYQLSRSAKSNKGIIIGIKMVSHFSEEYFRKTWEEYSKIHFEASKQQENREDNNETNASSGFETWEDEPNEINTRHNQSTLAHPNLGEMQRGEARNGTDPETTPLLDNQPNRVMEKLEAQEKRIELLEKENEEQAEVIKELKIKEEEAEKVLKEFKKRFPIGADRGMLSHESSTDIESVTDNPNLQPTSSDEVENKNESLSEDTFSFIACSRICSIPFWFGIIVFIVQVTTLTLLTADLYESPQNPLGIPANVEAPVRLAQFIAIFIAILTQDDLRTAIIQISDGYNVSIGTTFEEASAAKWWLSCLLRLLEGSFGLVVAFFLIITVDDVFDLLLNFTAIEFLFNLDDIAFYISSLGFFGSVVSSKTEQIKSTPFCQKNENTKKFLLSKIFLFLIVCALLLGWSIVIREQEQNKYLCEQLQIEFADNILIDLGGFSGVYGLDQFNRHNGRIQYVERGNNKNRGKIAYCRREQAWTFSLLNDDPCDKWKARSSETKGFDVRTTVSGSWVAKELISDVEMPLDFMKITCLDGSTCTGELDKMCICKNGEYGIRCEWKDLCPSLAAEPMFDGHKTYAKDYVILDGDFRESIQAYHRPIYVAKHGVPSMIENVDLIFYCGRRWVHTHTGALKGLKHISSRNDTIENGNFYLFRKRIAGYFQSEFQIHDLSFKSVSFISEATLSTGSPLGLTWYHSKYPESNQTSILPLPDLNRPTDAILTCGICSDDTKQCHHQGQCLSNQTCLCANRASGNRCEVKPIADGTCDIFFNTEIHSFDGGDCCATTCNTSNCGKSGSKFAFGAELDGNQISYDSCTDPSMIPLEIDLFDIGQDRERSQFVNVSSVKFICDNITILNVHGFKTHLSKPHRVYVSLDSNCNLSISLGEKDKKIGYNIYMPVSNNNAQVQYANGYVNENKSIDLFIFTPCFMTSDITKDVCLFEGKCLNNGLCKCAHRTSGRQCEMRPLGDGICDDYFNTAHHDYDGGDCCGATCNSTLCGKKGLHFAFGMHLNDSEHGYQDCVNPQMVPIVIDIFNTSSSALRYSNVEIQNISLSCNNVLFLSIVQLRMNLTDTHTVHVEDGSICKLNIETNETVFYKFEIYHYSKQNQLRTFLAKGHGAGEKEQDFFVTTQCWISELSSEAYASDYDKYNTFEKKIHWANTLLLNPSFVCEEYSKQRYAMTVLFICLGFMDAEQERTWLDEGNHECDWYKSADAWDQNGITCGRNNEVVNEIHFEKMRWLSFGLHGFIPTEIGLLSRLSSLKLGGNGLNGSIPTSIGLLRVLRQLHLNDNKLTNVLPSEIGYLKSLESLQINKNKITGELPESMSQMSHLVNISLSYNSFSGAITPVIGMLQDLSLLNLGNNQLRGTIPTEIGKLSYGLELLDLGNNKLSGSIPTEIGKLQMLDLLDLGNNNLNGTIPTEMRKIYSLKTIDLSENIFIGTIPTQIGGYCLDSLDLSDNNLSGMLNLRNNNLNGTLPFTSSQDDSFGVYGDCSFDYSSPKMKHLILSNNNFTGRIPTDIKNLCELEILDLEGNKFVGVINRCGNWCKNPNDFWRSSNPPSIFIGCNKIKCDSSCPCKRINEVKSCPVECNDGFTVVRTQMPRYMTNIAWHVILDDGTRKNIRMSSENLCIPNGACGNLKNDVPYDPYSRNYGGGMISVITEWSETESEKSYSELLQESHSSINGGIDDDSVKIFVDNELEISYDIESSINYTALETPGIASYMEYLSSIEYISLHFCVSNNTVGNTSVTNQEANASNNIFN